MSHGVTIKPDTWMPFYVGDYLRKTMHLTTEEHGAYLLLIMACWVNGGAIPDENKSLENIVGLSKFSFRKVRKKVAPFFDISDGVWRNKRVTEELAKALDLTEQRRSAGVASGAARRRRNANERSTSVATDAERQGQQNGRPSPSPSTDLLHKSDIRCRGKLFAKGLKLLGSDFRPLLAKMLDAHGNAFIAEALTTIDATNPDEPSKAFVRLCENKQTQSAKPNGPPPTPEELGWL